jgi:hypothetical protein
MPAPSGSPAYPSWAFNSAGQPSVIVLSLAAFNALPGPGTWSATPYPTVPATIPSDPGFIILDTRQQQLLIEARMQTMMLAQGFGIVDDPTLLRADVLANDSSVST